MSELPLLDEKPAWSVSELAAAIKGTLEKAYGGVRVRGELGRVTKAASGHMYFDLKDAGALINGVWFKGAQRKVPDMAEGLEVIVAGRLSTYPARSNYQLIVTSVEPAGVGALLKLIEERKKKLAAEGLFDEAKKRPLPYLPRVIGIITSPTGAVIHDMIHRLQDRFMPHVLLWPVQVQGEGAAAQVLAALHGFNSIAPGGAIPQPELLIIARGGGSVEDLMPFNDEALVRAVAASRIPVISAIGHETDWTLIDLAADVRAPTPTGAAEFAVPVKADLVATLADLRGRLEGVPIRLLEILAQKLDERSLRLGRGLQSWLHARRLQLTRLHLRSPAEQLGRQRDKLQLLGQQLEGSLARLLETSRQKLDERSLRLGRGLQSWLHARRLQLTRLHLRSPAEQLGRQRDRLQLLGQRLTKEAALRSLEPQRSRLQRLGEKLDVLSYRKTLERGFAVVRDEQAQPVTRAAQVAGSLSIEFADGRVNVRKA